VTRRIIASALTLAIAVGGASWAQGVDERIGEAQQDRAVADAQVRGALADLAVLRDEFARVERLEADATEAMLAALRRQLVLRARLAGARQVLALRARAAYKVGPASALEAFLSAHSPSELATAQALSERAFGSDTDVIAGVQNQQEALLRSRLDLVRQQAILRRQQEHLARLGLTIEARLADAEAAAQAADLHLAALERERAELAAAAAREAARRAALSNAADAHRYTGEADWDAIAQCEAGGNWAANTGNGYWGGLQFHPDTWSSYGGGPFDGEGPFPYSREEQIEVGERVLDSQGPGAWPNCFRSA
jgi:peptidoglycan hydrolase CwlO-like protein